MWGWTEGDHFATRRPGVFPTRVGVDRGLEMLGLYEGRFPHACGGGPTSPAAFLCRETFSPRVWGWTSGGGFYDTAVKVFPTRVGVDRSCNPPELTESRFPHACGGGPQPLKRGERLGGFSPRVWGWTVVHLLNKGLPEVFPTRVGVDRS